MTEQWVQCPKDPRVEYRREVCENIFRKGNYRLWCKDCEKFDSAEIVKAPA
jgi:hypothetical protein